MKQESTRSNIDTRMVQLALKICYVLFFKGPGYLDEVLC